MTPTKYPTDAELIAAYEAGPESLKAEITSMTREQLLARPVAGKWSTQEVVIHLADAENAFSQRIKRIVAEDNPTYTAWQENRFIERLAYDQQSAEDAVKLIELERRQIVRILKTVGPRVLDRTGVHAERGPQTGRLVVEYAAWHLTHHLNFIKEKKAKLGLA
ncbi:MAG: DinB family protein [Tepidisphaeraceae bacterium]